MRRGSVRTPRSARNASSAPGVLPFTSRVWSRRSCTSSSAVTARPISRSLWPPMNLVPLCITTVAPSASGRAQIGVANVLSTTDRGTRGGGRGADRGHVGDVERRVGGRLDPHDVGTGRSPRPPRRCRRCRRRALRARPCCDMIVDQRAHTQVRERRAAPAPSAPARTAPPTAAAMPDENAIARAALERADGFLQPVPCGGAVGARVLAGLAAEVAGEHDRMVQRFADALRATGGHGDGGGVHSVTVPTAHPATGIPAPGAMSDHDHHWGKRGPTRAGTDSLASCADDPRRLHGVHRAARGHHGRRRAATTEDQGAHRAGHRHRRDAATGASPRTPAAPYVPGVTRDRDGRDHRCDHPDARWPGHRVRPPCARPPTTTSSRSTPPSA